jgi:hypothetical protein
MRTHVTFRTGRFDASPPEHTPFETLGSFGESPGRDLVEWLREELARVPGLVVEGPVEEEWGWGLTVRAGEQAVAAHVGLLSDRPPVWLVVARPVVSLRPRPFGRVDQRGLGQVIETLHALLARAPEIDQVGWHEAGAFDRGVMDPAPTPFTPSPPERA